MKAPTPAQRRRARIDTPWQAGRFITEAGNALNAKHTPEFNHAARATADLLQRHICYARDPARGRNPGLPPLDASDQ